MQNNNKVKMITTKINPIDGAEMVWVPGGTFTMGSPDGVGHEDEHPAHQVTLSGYWIYKYPVTVAQYFAFCVATSRELPHFPTKGYSWEGESGWDDSILQQRPIVNVSWVDCNVYADWAGVKLPTEAQWAYAARGSEGRNYPWGGIATPEDEYNGWDEAKCANKFNSFDKEISTWPVGSFPTGVSWCGAHDMAGNVWEWCMDWYGKYLPAPVANPISPESGNRRVLRGGSWVNNEYYNRSAYRNYEDLYYCYYNVGFRCVSIES